MTGFDAAAGVALLLVRPGMLVLATPFFGAVYAPIQMRVGVTVILALVLAPFVAIPPPASAVGLLVVLAREMAIGLSLALAIRVLVVGAEFAGHFSGYQIGLSLGALIDPQTGVRNNILALVYANVAIVVCLVTNAHHALLRALAESYRELPIAQGSVDPALAASVAGLLGIVFVLGVRIATPVVIVMLIVEVAIGLAGRVAPALNVMIAGAPVRVAIGLLVVSATIMAFPAIISRYIPTTFNLAAELAAMFR